MDKPAATRLIQDTFENSFDKGRFIDLIRNLVKYVDESGNFSLHGNYIPDAFDQSIRSYERVGKYEDSDSNKTDILIVRLKKEHSLERARATQRNFVAWYLNGSRGGELKEAALVAFVSPDERDWRFSLVRMDYNLVDSPTGRVKVERELTPARRYSFVVGESESSHTAQVQLRPILEDDETKPLLSDFGNAFSIEVVTREFFIKYRELLHRVEEALQKLVEQNERIRDDFEARSVDTVNFAKKLLGQVVFLYFLQKKGWLGVHVDGKWGEGDKRFLRSLFERASDNGDNFFNSHLEYLFYDALGKEERGTADPAYRPRFNCKIPFLNGGLFDPINNYDWVHTDILLDNELFSNADKTREGDIGTGILDVFDRYNFTVKEDEPLDKEVAIDPEMLGKVFENLLEVKDRKSKGTYYTPREIVHYMCQESLINYLDTAMNAGEVPLVATPPPQGKLLGKPDPEQVALKVPGYRGIVPRVDIESLVRMGELATEHDTRVETYGKETERYSYKLPQSIRWNAKLIDDKLENTRVCDPTVGSGAFLVGMMTDIVRARDTLTTYLPDKQSRTKYNFKRHAIQNCLYGVDIDPGAVEIAKLRLWLSLVVDEEDIRQIQPLPNLDYKIMQGNSLIEDFHGISLAFGENGKGRPKLFEQDSELLCLVENLHRKQDNLFDATHPGEKEQQKAQVEDAIVDIFHHEVKRQRATYFQLLENIERRACQIPNAEDRHKYYKAEKATLDNKSGFDFEALERELREMTHGNKVRPFFPWRLYFANVFREKGGFDLVIANPPYLGEKGHKDIFQQVRRHSLGRYYQGKMDIFYFFFHLALDLGHQGTSVAFITTNYYITATGAKKLRKDFRERAILLRLINFNELRIFEAAQGQHNLVTILQRGHDDQTAAKTAITHGKGLASNEILQTILSWEDRQTDYYSIRQGQLYGGDEHYVRLAGVPEVSKVLDKIESQGVVLKAICSVNQGVVSGLDTLKKSHIEKYDLGPDYIAGSGVFVLSEDEIIDLHLTEKDKELLRPFFKNSHIRKYHTKENTTERLLYLTQEVNLSEYSAHLGRHVSKYSNIIKNIVDNPPYLHRPRKESIFLGEKIVAPYRSRDNVFGYNSVPWFALTDVYFITQRDKSIALKYVLALLNSKAYYLWLYYRGKHKGEVLEMLSQPLSEVPIKMLSRDEQGPFIDIVDRILAITADEDYLSNPAKQARVKELERQIDRMVYQLYDLTPEEIAVVEGSRKE